ncbi:histidine phosphatase family protein [Psychromonas sp. KJ10-10]|uniref:histidine phosphatase family protein n=1 Tax=Psychromonas sp. KJ10-10 TaxID=3391823 RepID=UPI0039B64F43
MSKKTILYLARHGQTQWNTEHRIQGQFDSALTAKGEQQALHLASLCSTLNISRILTSSLGRAIQTANICAQALQIEVNIVEGLKERHFGTWQGLLTPEVQNHQDYLEITSQITDCKPEQGESALQLLRRFQDTLKQQLQQHPQETFLVVTHGDVLRCFMAQFSPKDALQTGYDYKNGHLISIGYDFKNDIFFTL